MKAHESEIFLNKNESRFLPSPRCMQILKNISYESFTTYSSMNLTKFNDLKDMLADFLSIPKDYLLLGNGAEELLKLVIYLCASKNEKILVADCSWWYYQKIAQDRNLSVVYCKLKDNETHYSFCFEEFYKTYQQHQPKLVLLASPNNPTGDTLSINTLEKILEATKNSVTIIDEAYWGYANLDNSYCFDLIKKYPQAIFIRSFSKFFSLPGVRMGYAICDKQQYEDVFHYSDRYLGYNKLSLDLCLAAIKDVDYYANINLYFKKIKNIFYEIFPAVSPITAYRSEANFVLFKFEPELRQYLEHTFFRHKYVISFINKNPLENFLRISLGNDAENQDIITLLQRAMRFYHKTHTKMALTFNPSP